MRNDPVSASHRFALRRARDDAAAKDGAGAACPRPIDVEAGGGMSPTSVGKASSPVIREHGVALGLEVVRHKLARAFGQRDAVSLGRRR